MKSEEAIPILATAMSAFFASHGLDLEQQQKLCYEYSISHGGCETPIFPFCSDCSLFIKKEDCNHGFE